MFIGLPTDLSNITQEDINGYAVSIETFDCVDYLVYELRSDNERNRELAKQILSRLQQLPDPQGWRQKLVKIIENRRRHSVIIDPHLFEG